MVTAWLHACASIQVEGQEAAAVVSAQEIRVVAELLQVSPESLQKAVTYRMTVSPPSTSHSTLIECFQTEGGASYPICVFELSSPLSLRIQGGKRSTLH